MLLMLLSTSLPLSRRAYKMTLEEIMGQVDPKTVELRAKFNNAQFAVDLSYKIAEKRAYTDDVKVLNPDWKEGDLNYDKHLYFNPTTEQIANSITSLARKLKPEIEKDLNDTLSILDKPLEKLMEVKNESGKPKADTTQLH